MKSYTLSQINAYLQSQSLTDGNFENLLTYYTNDEFTKVTGNINTGINLVIDDDSILETFHVTTDMFWPQISQKIYDTDSLYWFLELLNPHIVKSPFGKIKAPNHVKYLPMALSIIRNA